MNTKIAKLKNELETATKYNSIIKEKLQAEYNKLFDNDKALQEAINKSQSSNEYSTDMYGEIVSCYRYSGLSDFDDDVRPYLKEYLNVQHCLVVDFENDALILNQGESIVIQSDGVYLAHKCIIKENEYMIDGEVNETKRNTLIESCMEKTGYFPGVFTIDQHGNVFSVNTQGVVS